MWDQGSKGWDQGSDGWDLRSQPWAQGSQTMGSESALGIILSVSTLRRLFNLLANSHIPPTTRNARSTTEERVIIVLYIEASLSTKPVDLSTARGIGDS